MFCLETDSTTQRFFFALFFEAMTKHFSCIDIPLPSAKGLPSSVDSPHRR